MDEIGLYELHVMQTSFIQHPLGVFHHGRQIDRVHFAAPRSKGWKKKTCAGPGIETSIPLLI
jgi:hypothetical protein